VVLARLSAELAVSTSNVPRSESKKIQTIKPPGFQQNYSWRSLAPFLVAAAKERIEPGRELVM